MTDQTDAKLLLGTYVTSTPGSFTWRAGILTTAVKEGKWIVIEDIERAGNDVLSVLLPLLEKRPLSLNGRGEIEMAKGGQLIATTRYFPSLKLLLMIDFSRDRNPLRSRIRSEFIDGLESLLFLPQTPIS